jgi:hypothetical protein
MNRRFILGALVGTLALGACDEERADLNSPDFPDAFGFQLVQSGTTLPRGTARFGVSGAALDSLQLTMAGLDSLNAGSYAVWIGDSLGGTFRRATGTLTAARADTTFDADGNPIANIVTIPHGSVSSFKNGGPNQTLTFRTTRAASGLGATDPMQHVFVSIESDAGATSPSDVRPLFARRGDAAISGVARNPALIFGNYGVTVADQYRFVTQIRGRGGFRGPVLMVTDSLMSRPPKGYYYAGFVFKRALGDIVPDTVYLGEQRSPWPNRDMSQRNADVSITDPANVFDTPFQIRAGQFRIDADTIAKLPADKPYKEYFEIWVTLQAKGGFDGRMSPNRIAFAPVPTKIWNGERQ